MHSVKDGKYTQLKRCLTVSILLSFLFAANQALQAEADDANGVLRSRAYKFNHITSQKAQEILSQLNIGKSFDALNDDVLIVTSEKSSDLIKATGVLSVLDQSMPAAVRVLLVKTDQQPLPDIDALSAKMQTFTVGTMTDAPPKGSNLPVILDVLDNKLIAIAAEELLPSIEKNVEEWVEANPPQVPSAQATEEPEQVTEQELPGEEQGEAAKADVEEQESQAQKAEPQEQQPAVVIETEKQDESGMSLQEIMSRLLQEEEGRVAVAEPNLDLVPVEAIETDEADLADMLETEPNSTEEYIGDELLKVLLDEEKKTQPQVAVQPEEVVPTEQEQVVEQPDISEDVSLQEAIKMLLGTSAEAEETIPTEQPVQPVLETPTEEPQRSDAVSENLRLQRELAVLRQQLAETQGQTTLAAETVDAEEAEADEPEKKIITQQEPTLTEFEKAVGDKELETVIDLPQEVELENLVDLVGKQLGLNYMYDPAILRNQKVFLKIHQGKIKVKDLYGLLESVLRFRGFVMTRRDDLVTILKSGDANQVATQTDTVFRMPGDPIMPGDIIVSTIFQLENIAAADAQKMLAAMKLGLANGFQLVAETNTLIVTDYAYRMGRIEDVLEMIDVAGEEKVFEYRSLKYLQATDLVAKLKELVAQMEGVSMQVSTTPTAAAKATPTQYTTQRVRNPQTGRIETKRVPVTTQQVTPGQTATAAKDTVFIDTDERTNRILMIGTQSQIDTINQLADTLDVPQHDLKFVKEYVIQNVEAVEVINVLNELGLAQLSVSGGKSATTPSTAARQATASRTAQAQQQAAAQPTATVSGGDGQPNISIRPATNSLLVNGTEEQHEAIELVIAHVDVVQKDQRTIREYEIQYVDTQEIIDTMTELGIISSQSVKNTSQSSRSSSSSRSTSSRTTQQPTQATAQDGAGPQGLAGLAGGEGSPEDITAQEPQIAVLEATNSLLVYATPRQHKAISLLIAHADRVPETTTTPYVVYALENQAPTELAEVLTKLVQETVEEVGKTSTPESKIQTAGGAAGGGAGAAAIMEEQDIKIIADEPSYSLIVYANKRNQQWISELIAELDEYRPQVLLDCTLVEVFKNDEFTYSIDLIAKSYGSTSIQASSPVEGTVGNNLFSNRVLSDISSQGGSVVGFLNSQMVQGVLEALQTNQYGRIMAQPKILVNDNQIGEIKTQTSKSIPEISSQTTTTDGVTNTSSNVAFSTYEKGVTLNITPHISKGDMLRLEISLNRTDFNEQGTFPYDGDDYQIPPDLISTDVETIATVPDGTTIVLGGLESVSQTKGQNKVPILGDLPIVGGLFRGVDNIDGEDRLYVFVKANIIRPGDQIEGLEDIRRVSGKYRAEFEEMEEKFQKMQDWPGIDAKPMEPVKVLEEDFIEE